MPYEYPYREAHLKLPADLSITVNFTVRLIQGSERMNILLLLQLYLVSNDNVIHQGGIAVNSSEACLEPYAQRLLGTLVILRASKPYS